MIVLAGGAGVLVPSDETDIVNHLQEFERRRLRKAKIAEIRARMKEESSNHDQTLHNSDANPEKAKETAREKISRFLENAQKYESAAADVSKGAGSGCVASATPGEFRIVNKNKVTKNNNFYEYVSGSTMGMKKMNKQGKVQFWKVDKTQADRVANTMSAGKVLQAAAIAVDAHSIYTAASQDYKEGTKHHTVHTAASIAGSWTGSIQGATYGAAVCSAIPVWGSLIGGIVGGLVGSVAGDYAATTFAETVCPTPKGIFETPGQCALCHEKFACFNLFTRHFVKAHASAWLDLHAAVVKRAGEERIDIEDPWFYRKAFVTKSWEIYRWKLANIRKFNDRILARLGWDIEKEIKEKKEREERERKERERIQKEYDEKARIEQRKIAIAKYRQSGFELFMLFGKITSVIPFISYSQIPSLQDRVLGGMLRV